MFESLSQRTVIIGNSGAGKSALAESLDPAAFEGSGLSMTHTAEFILHQFLHPSF